MTPEQAKEYRRAYYLKNKERLDSTNKAWYHRNKDRVKEYREKNKEKIRAKTQEAYWNNREALLQRNKDWRTRNQEKVRIARKAKREPEKDELNKNNRIQYEKPHIREKKKRISYKSGLKRKYGITEADYLLMLEHQGGGCGICGDKENGGKRLFVDHCHSTGSIRGLLCSKCNTGIGLLGDTVERIKSALLYLTEPVAAKLGVSPDISKRTGRTKPHPSAPQAEAQAPISSQS